MLRAPEAAGLQLTQDVLLYG